MSTREQKQAAAAEYDRAHAALEKLPASPLGDRDPEYRRLNDAAYAASKNPNLPLRYKFPRLLGEV